MTINDKSFDRALPSLFVELASASTPDYLEAAIERASSRPQRPAWTYPGRWLPVDITTEAVPAARLPWRQLGILALIGLLTAVAAVAYVGARRDPSPAPPFGLAAAGAIAMERDGDILTVDHVTGAVTPIITGPEVDAAPVYFRDGTRIAFERRVEGPGDQRLIMVANADGSGITQATPDPLSNLIGWSVSPDGSDVLVTTLYLGKPQVAVLAVDGSREPTTLDVPLSADPDEAPSYRPPDGREILVVGQPKGSATRGIYVVDATSGAPPRTIVEPSVDSDICGAVWSPTGDTLVYCVFDPAGDGIRFRTRIVSANGSGSRPLNPAPDVAYDGALSDWSNDGTRLVVVRGDATDGTGERVVIMSVAGDAPPVKMECEPTGDNKCPDSWIWSPDDQQLLGILVGDDGAVRYFLADPDTGLITPTAWTGTGPPSWQRSAP
jgi:dipeptidyl aminopeptidase/acylaminoacyl peptidase